jgi:hypothetical protein
MSPATKEKEEVNEVSMEQLSDPEHGHKKTGHPNFHKRLTTFLK